MPRTVLSLVATLLAGAAVAGFEATLSPRLIEEALLLGQSRFESAHTRFHQPYRIQGNKAPVDYVDVVTPFRRVVLLTEERTQSGYRGFTQREAIAAMGDRTSVVELRVEMTFHPLNVFVGVPGYDVELVTTTVPPMRLMPRDVVRIPRFGARIEGAPLSSPPGGALNQPGVSQPLIGGTIVAAFPIDMLNPAEVHDVLVSEQGKEFARARLNFGGLR